MTLKLHCFGESGNSYKAALALELSALSGNLSSLTFWWRVPNP